MAGSRRRDHQGLHAPARSWHQRRGERLMQKTTAQLTRAISSQMLLNSILRTDVMAFVRKTFDTVSPGDRFSANWHIEALCHQLSKIAAGHTRRLIITIPPRHLKSICTSVALPAFILGHDPTRRIICVSYSQELAVKHANDCRGGDELRVVSSTLSRHQGRSCQEYRDRG